MQRIPQSVALRVPLKVYLSSDHVSPATGKTVAVVISKNGAAFGNPSAGATNATEVANGWYYVDLSGTDTGTLGPLVVRGTSAGCDDSEPPPFNVVNAHNAGFDALPSAAAEGAGGLFTRGTGAGQVNQDANGRIDANVKAVAGNAQTADANGLLKVDVEDWKGTAAAATNTAGVPVVDGRSASLRVGTAQAGSSTSITLDAGASATTDFYKYLSVAILSGTGAGQGGRVITAYNGGTKVATVTPAWATNPDATSVFALAPAAADLEAWSGGAAPALSSGNVPANVRQWQGSGPAALTFDGYVQADVEKWVGVVPSGVVGGVGGNPIPAIVSGYNTGQDPGSYVLATPSQKLATDGSGRVTVGSNADKAGYTLTVTPPTAAQIATAVLTDANAADFATAGTPGAVLVTQLGGAFTTNASSVFTTAALANAPAGGGGTADWTSAERNQIRQALGVSGTTAGSTGAGTLDAIKAKTDLITAGSVSVLFTSPVASNLALSLVAGDDYRAADGRALAWSSAAWPSLAGAAITFTATWPDGSQLTKAGSAPTGTSAQVELTAADTAGRPTYAPADYALTATLASGHVCTLVRGPLLVVSKTP